MKMRVAVVSFLLLSRVVASACSNFSELDLNGAPRDSTTKTSRATLLSHESQETWQHWKSVMEQRRAAQPLTQAQLSDYGGILAHLGEYAKARTVLEEADRMQPDNYAVAANLGTVYELLGENQKAYEWIAKGMKLNPGSHGGTEWLHLRILEVKLALAKEPKWLETHTVLDSSVDYGREARPKAPKGSREKRITSLAIQLHERLQFVAAPEPIVGELLFALGNEVLLDGSLADAVSIFELAYEYQPVRITLLRERLAFARALIAKRDTERQRARVKLESTMGGEASRLRQRK